MTDSVKKVVVVGGGFGGINLVKKIWKHKEFVVTKDVRRKTQYAFSLWQT